MKQLWRAEGVTWGARALRGKGLILEVIVGAGPGCLKGLCASCWGISEKGAGLETAHQYALPPSPQRTRYGRAQTPVTATAVFQP